MLNTVSFIAVNKLVVAVLQITKESRPTVNY